MSQRTTVASVATLLSVNWSGYWDTSIANTTLQPFVDSAWPLVDRVVACASTKKGVTLTSGEQEIIERWLAAWYYTKSDPMYERRSTEKADGRFIAGKKEPEYYKDAAIGLDYSGCLNAILNRLFASAAWLGRNAIDQTNLEDR